MKSRIFGWRSLIERKLLRLIKRSSFLSIKDLQPKILDFIEYFNQYFGKPFV